MYKWQKCWMFVWLEGSEASTSAKTDYPLSLIYFEVDVHTLLRVISTGIVAPIICKYFSFYFRCFSTFDFYLLLLKIFIANRSIRSRFTFFRYSFPWFAFTGALSLIRSKYDYLLCRFCVEYRKQHRKAFWELEVTLRNSCTKSTCILFFVFAQLFCFLPNFSE